MHFGGAAVPLYSNPTNQVSLRNAPVDSTHITDDCAFGQHVSQGGLLIVCMTIQELH